MAKDNHHLLLGAALERAVLDYAHLRDQARACATRP